MPRMIFLVTQVPVCLSMGVCRTTQSKHRNRAYRFMLDLPGYSTVDQTLYIDLRGTTALLEKKTDWEWQFKQVKSFKWE